MAKYPVAYFREKNDYFIVIPVSPDFHDWPREKQFKTIQTFQQCAYNDGLRGFVVPVWELKGQLFSLPPSGFTDFFRKLSVYDVKSRMNAVINCY